VYFTMSIGIGLCSISVDYLESKICYGTEDIALWTVSSARLR
jgi:hypothetical protein